MTTGSEGPGIVATAWVRWDRVAPEFLEFEITLDDVEFNWDVLGATGSCPGPAGGTDMDIENVMAHEVGHVIGLGHPHNADSHTMWGYTTKGETHKRSLATGDENGANALY